MLLDSEALEARADRFSELLHDGTLHEAAREAAHVSALRTGEILMEMPPEQVLAFLRVLGWERAAGVAQGFPTRLLAAYVDDLEDDEAVALCRALPATRAADIIPEVVEERRALLLDALSDDVRYAVEHLLRYAPDEVGAEMSPDFLSVRSGTTVRDTQRAVKTVPMDGASSAYIYVVDRDDRLQGVLSLRELMLARASETVDRYMAPDVFAVRDTDAAIEAARRIRSRGLRMLPVIDRDDCLVGTIGIQRALDLLASDVAESVLNIGGTADESFFTPPKRAIANRLPWMAANVFLNLGAVWVITGFEATIEQVAILAAFLPMITDMGGNVGIQALSVSIRSMALGEARVRDVWKALRKELAIGVVNGLALGVLFGIIVMVMQQNLTLAVVAAMALGANVLIAGIVGGTIPFLIKRLGKDPAMMTGPVLTTITDISGVTIYLGLSTIFLSALMLA